MKLKFKCPEPGCGKRVRSQQGLTRHINSMHSGKVTTAAAPDGVTTGKRKYRKKRKFAKKSIALREPVNYCPRCRADLRENNMSLADFCFGCGGNLRSVGLAMAFAG